MPKFGSRSRKNLSTCHEDLQDLFNEVIKHVDCSVIEGHRSKERQNKLYEEGKTKVKYPKASKTTKEKTKRQKKHGRRGRQTDKNLQNINNM